MKKFAAYLEKNPAILLVICLLFAVVTGFMSICCFQMYDQFKPAEILNEHLAVFALPIAVLFLYWTVRLLSAAYIVIRDMLKQKMHMKHSKF